MLKSVVESCTGSIVPSVLSKRNNFIFEIPLVVSVTPICILKYENN